jgi:aspartyl/asparaginyl beta-hydroxylase (cupin superfamily)
MQIGKNKLWYGSSRRPFPGNEPWYFEVKNLPWAIELEKNWPNWCNEINNFIKEKDDKFISTAVFYGEIDKTKSWSALISLFWGLKVSTELNKKCPQLNKLVKQIPGLVSFSISRLNANSKIGEHEGDTNGIMRCHLGIEVPGAIPECGFKVNGESRSWENGKCLIFNDAYRHSAWNNTDKRRIIIIMDIIRPEFMEKKNLICASILARHVSYLYNKVKLINKMPSFMKTLLFGFVMGLIIILKPVYNLFKG